MLNRLSKHVYWLAPDETTDRPTLGVIVGDETTLIVDAGNSPAHANLLLDEIAKRQIVAPKYLVLTHSHWDHVFGVAAFDVTTFASQETQAIVAEMATLDWSDAALDRRVEDGTEIEFCRDMIKVELPERSNLQIKTLDIAFTGQLEFDLGGLSCIVKHVGGDHASDSTVVYVPEDKIIFLGDCLYEDLHHGPRNYTIPKLFPLIDEIMSFQVDYYVWGHHPEPMPKVEMSAFVDLLKSLGELVEQVGDDRDLILGELQKGAVESLDEESVEIVDAFLAGLRRH